ncbi:MAG: sigma-70 family RNA polymerase sigma factor [Bacteroidota bacterium]
MPTHSLNSSDILQGISNRDDRILSLLYEDYYPMVEQFVMRNQGNYDDAKDIFHEALIYIFQKVRKDEFSLSGNFRPYFFVICKNLWLQALRKKKNTPLEAHHLKAGELPAHLEGEEQTQLERYTLYQEYFALLGQDCRFILKKFLNGFSLARIAEELNFTAKYVKKRKYVCQKKLIDSIMADPRYDQLKITAHE